MRTTPMRRPLAALIAAAATALGVLLAAPAHATVEYGNPNAVIGAKNSPASYTYGMVQLHDTTYGSFFLDTIAVGDSKGEGTSSDVFAEPVRFRLIPGQCGRYRTWYGPDPNNSTNMTANAFTSWFHNGGTADEWVAFNANGQVPLNQTNMYGRYLFEFQLASSC